MNREPRTVNRFNLFFENESFWTDRTLWILFGLTAFFAACVEGHSHIPAPLIVVALYALTGWLVYKGWRQPEWWLYAAAAYAPYNLLFGRYFGKPLGVTFLDVCVLGMLLGLRKQRSPASVLSVWFGAALSAVLAVFCLYGTGSLLVSVKDFGLWYGMEQLSTYRSWITPLACYFAALGVIRDAPTIKRSVAVILFSCVLVAAMAVLAYDGDGRVYGVADNPNYLAAFFVAYAFFFPAWILMEPKRWAHWVLAAPFLLCARGVMVTFSRGGYLAFAAGTYVLLALRSRLLLLAGVALGVFLFLNPHYLPSGIQYRMGMTVRSGAPDWSQQEDFSKSLEASASNRVEMWRGALKMIREHPWTGVGFGAFPTFIAHYSLSRVAYVDAHDYFLLVGAELGLIGLALFCTVLLIAAGYGIRLYLRAEDPFLRALGLGFVSGMAALCVSSLFSSMFSVPVTVIYFWMLCALVTRAVGMETARS